MPHLLVVGINIFDIEHTSMKFMKTVQRNLKVKSRISIIFDKFKAPYTPSVVILNSAVLLN